MLELTRRMTATRSHLVRLAGAYMDEEGYVDGNFNINFLNLKGEERKRCLNIAKAIPFSETNKELVSYKIPGIVPGSTDTAHVNVYQKDGCDGKALLEVLGV